MEGNKLVGIISRPFTGHPFTRLTNIVLKSLIRGGNLFWRIIGSLVF
jgi:hypothetical protein